LFFYCEALMSEKLLTWLTAAFDAFAIGAVLALGLKMFASETEGPHIMQSAWMCIGIAALCWAVIVGLASRHGRPGRREDQPVVPIDVRTAEREGQDGVYFRIDRPDGRYAFVVSRSVLEGLVDSELPNKEAMLLAFEIYSERIARTAAAFILPGQTSPVLLTPSAFYSFAMHARRQPAASRGLRMPRFS
jgi:hypothetical protein